MMSATNWPFIQQEMIRYGMTVYLGLGLVGNICHCIMFTHHSHRRTASSIYFFSLSILAIFHLVWSVVPLIYTLNHTDLQNQSVFYCKVRLYGSLIFGICVRYILVFACADRFSVTRINVRIRALNSVSIAIKFVFILCVVSLVSAIHLPILINITDGVCEMTGLYRLIYAIYQLTFVGILPPVLMSIFSILAIRSLHQRHGIQTRARQRDRHLMRMVIAEVIVNILTSIPYSINLVYRAATYYVVNKSAQRLEIESFISFVTQFLVYLINVAPFYVFLLTSKAFRNDFINIFIKCRYKSIVQRARIVPANEQNNIVPMNGGVARDQQQERHIEYRSNWFSRTPSKYVS